MITLQSLVVFTKNIGKMTDANDPADTCEVCSLAMLTGCSNK